MKRVEISEEEILALMEEGESAKDIADIKGVADATIYNKIKLMDPDKVKEAKEKGAEKRKEKKQKKKAERSKLLEQRRAELNLSKEEAKEKAIQLVKDGEEVDQIVEETGISEAVVYQIRASMKMTADKMRTKLERKEMKASEIREYRHMIEEKYDKVTYKEVILLVEIYVRTKQSSEAIRYLNQVINNEDLQHLGIEKMKQLKEKVEHIQKRQTVRNYLREGKDVAYIMEKTTIKESEIAAIKRSIEKTTLPKRRNGIR